MMSRVQIPYVEKLIGLVQQHQAPKVYKFSGKPSPHTLTNTRWSGLHNEGHHSYDSTQTGPNDNIQRGKEQYTVRTTRGKEQRLEFQI